MMKIELDYIPVSFFVLGFMYACDGLYRVHSDNLDKLIEVFEKGEPEREPLPKLTIQKNQ